LIAASLAVTLVLALPSLAQGAESAAQELAVKYSPVLSLEPQTKPCGTREAYRPTSVDIALGRQESRGTRIRRLDHPRGGYPKHWQVAMRPCR
jgi:hypothetical protein